MNKQQQKLSNINLILITISMTELFSLPNTISSISAQNISTKIGDDDGGDKYDGGGGDDGGGDK